jgi:hypothetical protein
MGISAYALVSLPKKKSSQQGVRRDVNQDNTPNTTPCGESGTCGESTVTCRKEFEQCARQVCTKTHQCAPVYKVRCYLQERVSVVCTRAREPRQHTDVILLSNWGAGTAALVKHASKERMARLINIFETGRVKTG